MTTIPRANHRFSDVDTDAFPKPVPFRHLLRLDALPQRPLRIALPCVGIDGCTRALAELGVPFEPVNVYDIEPGVKEVLLAHHGDKVKDQLFLGPVKGDLTRAHGDNLTLPVDGLCAGPPCPPWAGNGNRGAEADPRANVFKTVLLWVQHFVKRGGLIFCVLENVKGIKQKIGGEMSFVDKSVRQLSDNCPELVWDIFTLGARDYLLPQERNRVFLVGIRRAFAARVPEPAPKWGTYPLSHCLNRALPSTDLDTLTPNMKVNMIDYEASKHAEHTHASCPHKSNSCNHPRNPHACTLTPKPTHPKDQIAQDIENGKLSVDDVVVCAADRAKGKVYRQHITVGAVPTLTTSNKYLFIVACDEIANKVPIENRQLFRWLHPLERLCLQGFDPAIGVHMTAKIIYKTTGNAYPVNLLAAILQPIIATITKSSLLQGWPNAERASVNIAEARLRWQGERRSVLDQVRCRRVLELPTDEVRRVRSRAHLGSHGRHAGADSSTESDE